MLIDWTDRDPPVVGQRAGIIACPECRRKPGSWLFSGGYHCPECGAEIDPSEFTNTADPSEVIGDD
jgi:DNA-directed RNA polymerase subunit RPC12/RpoP